MIDASVVRFPYDASPSDRTVKQQLVQAVSQKFSDDGRTLPTVLEAFAQHLGQYAEGDFSRLDVPVWQGPVGG